MNLQTKSNPQIELTDVTLRDGLQALTQIYSTSQKMKLFEKLRVCQYQRYEVTSFVNPKWVPQFADNEAFCREVCKSQVPTMAFVPNLKGLERLLSYSIPWVSCFISASESFNQKNINQEISATLKELGSMVKEAHRNQRKIRIYISTVFGCPYEGAIEEKSLQNLLKELVGLNPDEIAISDTIGVATPPRVKEVVNFLKTLYPLEKIALHFHDTYGAALANVQAGYECGIYKFDGSSGGIGGCPYAKGATGNVAIEDVAYLFQRMGAYANFQKSSVNGLLDFLKNEMSLIPNSSIHMILEKGGELYAS